MSNKLIPIKLTASDIEKYKLNDTDFVRDKQRLQLEKKKAADKKRNDYNRERYRKTASKIQFIRSVCDLLKTIEVSDNIPILREMAVDINKKYADVINKLSIEKPIKIKRKN